MIPIELKRLDRWVCWSLIDDRKIPINPRTGKAASSTDPMTWGTYDEAKEGENVFGCTGIGFVFNGDNYCGIDLDDVADNGNLSSKARLIIDECRSYTEYSPSGTGVHIIVKASLPFGALKTVGLEIYNTGRYFTMTDKPVPCTVPLIRDVDLDWLYPEERKKPNMGPKAPPLTERLGALAEGNRNTNFLSIAGSLRAKGIDNIAIFELLKPRAKAESFSEAELWTVCNRYSDKGIDNSINEDTDDFGAFMADRKPVEWLCEGLIPRHSLGFFVGLPEAAKTWMGIDLALEIARGGGLWLGKYPVKAGKVYFIDQERGKQETQRRFDALMKNKGLTIDDIRDNLVVKVGTTFRLDHQQSFEGIKKKLEEFRPDVIIWDSFATSHGSEENNKSEIQKVIENAKWIRNRYGCAFMWIDHENKNTFQTIREKEAPTYGNQAGSIAKPAAAEFVFTIRKETSGGSWVYHTKSTQAPPIAPFLIRVVDVKPDRSEIKVEAQ